MMIIDSNKHRDIPDDNRYKSNSILTNGPQQDFQRCKVIQLELSKKEAVILLDNSPARDEGIAFEADKYRGLDVDKKIEILKKLLDEWRSTRKELHLGLHHTKAFKPLPFPEPLLVILFLHCYAITDETSLTDFEKFISSDFIPEVQQVQPKYDIYDPKWLGPHLVTNVVEIARNTVGMGNDGVIQDLILVNAENNATRLRMAILYSTTKSLLKILLKYGGDPKLPDNPELNDFRKYLNNRASDGTPQTVTEVIFDALPYILQYHKKSARVISQSLPPKSRCMSDRWEAGVTFDDFNISIPVHVKVGNHRSLQGKSIMDYFEGVFNGSIPFSTIIDCIPEPVQITTPKKSPTKNAKGGGGVSSPKKKKIDTDLIQNHLSAIETAVSQIPETQIDESLKTAITTATTEIRKLVSED